MNLNIGRCLKKTSYFRPGSTGDKFTSRDAANRQEFEMDFLKCEMNENVSYCFASECSPFTKIKHKGAYKEISILPCGVFLKWITAFTKEENRVQG